MMLGPIGLFSAAATIVVIVFPIPTLKLMLMDSLSASFLAEAKGDDSDDNDQHRVPYCSGHSM